jgi:DNA-binding NarL/FixJ family response regulator
VSSQIRVVIADDHPLFRKGVTEVLRSDPSVELVAEASDGETAIRLMKEHRPSIAIIDLDMPKQGGLAVAEAVHRDNVPVALVILTMYDDGRMLERALALGVRGYVLKESAAGDLLACLHLVAEGRTYVSPALSHHLVTRRNQGPARDGLGALESLTAVERKVLALVAREFTTGTIARELGISAKTVENHRSHICAKLGVRGHNSLVRFAMRHRDELS